MCDESQEVAWAPHIRFIYVYSVEVALINPSL